MKNFLKNIIFSTLSIFIIRKGIKGGVYITFDDGPHPENTAKILNILKTADAKATFFMVGDGMEKYPDVVRNVIEAGHSIGYHSYDHHSLKHVSLNHIKNDFIKLTNIETRFKFKFKLYRPPYGDLTFLSMMWLIIKKLKVVLWSVDSNDSFQSKNNVINNVHPDKIANGDILLFHDDYDLTVEVLPEILHQFFLKNIKCKAL